MVSAINQVYSSVDSGAEKYVASGSSPSSYIPCSIYVIDVQSILGSSNITEEIQKFCVSLILNQYHLRKMVSYESLPPQQMLTFEGSSVISDDRFKREVCQQLQQEWLRFLPFRYQGKVYLATGEIVEDSINLE